MDKMLRRPWICGESTVKSAQHNRVGEGSRLLAMAELKYRRTVDRIIVAHQMKCDVSGLKIRVSSDENVACAVPDVSGSCKCCDM
jgi:hypothetical protein